MTLDFGVAVHPVDGDQKSALMNIADQRLYQMKISGRAKIRGAITETPAAPQSTAEPQAVPRNRSQFRSRCAQDTPVQQTAPRHFD